jgi:hypothetical protein
VSAAPAAPRSALELLRSKLADSGITEARLICWLKDRDAIPVGARGLQCIATRRLKIISEECKDTILPQLLP